MLGGGPSTTDDQIRLALPAEAEYGRIARIAAAGLALRVGFSYPEIEDLRLAIDESVILLLRGDSRAERLTVLFDPGPGELIIDARTSGGNGPPPDDAILDRFSSLVGEVVDRFDVDEGGHHVHLGEGPRGHRDRVARGRMTSDSCAIRGSQRPVWPNPPSPRPDGGRASTGSSSACSTRCTTSWAIR
ncbi:MAG: hypothetical protein U5R31_06895 [Acidimicrobiia bacterium]|nr:hypothetical protein [Acidimicrobiia bacterium]